MLALHPKVQNRMYDELEAYWTSRNTDQVDNDEEADTRNKSRYPESPRLVATLNIVSHICCWIYLDLVWQVVFTSSFAGFQFSLANPTFRNST